MNNEYITNEKRSAHDKLAGYEYQIYSSTLAWIQLRNNETLYLERAEDHDLVRDEDESVVASQVKKSKSPFTLRSHEVVEAINNFWELKQKNTNIRIFFRFITQTTYSKEKGSPFGDIEGIEYWKRCQRGEDITLLKEFLLSLPTLSDELRSFLNKASLTEINDQLVQPISWEFSSSDFSQIEYEIKLSLVERGESLGYSAQESEAVFGILISHCFKVACGDKSEDRKLTLNDFSEIFNEHLQIITANKKELKAEIHQHGKMINDLTEVVQKSISQTGISNTDFNLDLNQLPSLTQTTYIERPLLENKIRDLLIKYGFVTLTGSSGNGKSTLSTLVVRPESEKWRKISFRGMKASEANFQLLSLIKKPEFIEHNFIFDDLNLNQNIDPFREALQRISFLLKRAGKKVIITSQNKPDVSLLNSINVPLDTTVAIQAFSLKEIEEMLKKYNCPVETIGPWANEIFTVTNGHPQMVHARIIRLSANNWDVGKLFFETTELKEIKKKKAKDLINELPSPESRDLAIRLSVLSKKFKTKNAYEIARFGEPIKNYRAAFSQLIGPYIEEVGNGYFQLSELLEGTYKVDYTENEVKELHTTAGFSYLDKTLTPQDASNIFWHALSGRSMKLLYFGFSAFMSIKGKEKQSVYPYLSWLPLIAVDTNQLAVPEDELMNQFFRSIQFSISAEMNDFSNPEKIAEIWLQEVKNFSGNSPLYKKHPETKFILFMFFLNVSQHINLNFSVNFRFRLLYEAFAFINDNPEIEKMFPNINEEGFTHSGWKSLLIEMMFSIKLSADEIFQLLSLISTCNLNEEIFTQLDKCESACRRLNENMWLDFVDDPDVVWEYHLSDLKTLSEMAINNNALNLYIKSQRSIAIIEFEYEKSKNRSEVIDFLDQSSKKIEFTSSDLEDYKAKVHFLEGDYESAVKIWVDLLSSWIPQEGSELIKTFALRNTGVSFAMLKDWPKAEKYFFECFESINLTDDTASQTILYKYQALGEFAFSLWKNGKHQESIQWFCKLINHLPDCPDPNKDLRSLGLLKAISNTFIHLLKEVNPHRVTPNADYAEPYPGYFSQFDYNEQLKQFPVQPYKTLFTFLAEIEYELEAGSSAYEELEKCFNSLPNLFKIKALDIKILTAIRNSQFAKAIDSILELFVQVGLVKQLRDENAQLHETTVNVTEESRKLFLEEYSSAICLILAVLPITGDFESISNELKIAIKKVLKIYDTTSQELKDIYELLSNITVDIAEEVLKDGKESTSKRLLAAIYLIDHSNNKDLLLYSSGVLTTTLPSIMLNQELAGYLLKKINPIWHSIGERQHRLWKDLESAKLIYVCENQPGNDLQSCAAIILKAKDLCLLNIDVIQSDLEAISSGKYDSSVD